MILDQSIAEITHQLQAKKQTVPPIEYLQQQALEQLITRQAQLEQVKRYNVKADEKALNEAVLKVAKDSGSPSLEAFPTKTRCPMHQIPMLRYALVLLKILHCNVYANNL